MEKARIRLAGVGLLLALLAALSLLAPGHAAAKTATWLTYDVTITVNTDGSFHVSERQRVQFSGGSFHYGYRDVDTSRTEDLSNVTITEITANGEKRYTQVTPGSFSQTPGTFMTQQQGNYLHVEYGFDQPSGGIRTFLLDYDAKGALRVYKNETPPNEQVYWNAIDSALTQNGNVEQATATIVLPQAVDLSQVVLGEDSRGPASAHTTDGRVWTWTKSGLGSGDQFVVRMQFPPIVDAPVPTWQAADDKSRADAAARDHRNTIIGAIGLALAGLGLSGGGVWLYRLWWTKGRAPYVPAVAEYVSEPPDDLTAPLVGALLDEQAGNPQLVAMLIDLARRGFFTIQNVSSDGAGKANRAVVTSVTH